MIADVDDKGVQAEILRILSRSCDEDGDYKERAWAVEATDASGNVRQIRQPPGGPAKATLERQTRFLEKLVECDGNIIRACRRAKVSRAMHYHWFDNEATYKDRYDYARRIIFDQMESELFDRAKVSDMLFRFALESRFPDMYGKKLKLDGAAPVHSLDPEKLKALTDQELDTLIRLSKKVAVQQA